MPMQKGSFRMRDAGEVAKIKEQLEQGDYRVEPDAVAEAFLRHLRELARARRERVSPSDRALAAELEGQIMCSYPDSAPGASVNVTSAGPATTRPTKLSSILVGRLSHSVATMLRAPGGTVTQSS
jgi:Anti-sigma-28 factor, FlgM